MLLAWRFSTVIVPREDAFEVQFFYDSHQKRVVNVNENKFVYVSIEVRAANIRAASLKRLNITSFTITYVNCPPIVFGLARYVNTAGARDKTSVVSSKGICSAHSETESRTGTLTRTCDFYGNTTFEGRCLCLGGYQNVKDVCKGRITHFQLNFFTS